MPQGYVAKTSITINTSSKKVWEALVSPPLIKEYLFGTEVVTEWRVGGPILYKGVWQGNAYEDKGTILQLVPEKIFQSTYWSSMGGSEDRPENYATVTYQIDPSNDETILTVTQDNNATEIARDHSQKNWDMVLESIKKLVES